MDENPTVSDDGENSPVSTSATVENPTWIEKIRADEDGRVTLDLGDEAAGQLVHVAAAVEEGDDDV